MGLFRLLILVALLATAYWLWRRLSRPRRPAAERPAAQPMVRCAHCRLHIPREQGLQQDDRWYCSQAHLEQDRREREQ